MALDNDFKEQTEKLVTETLEALRYGMEIKYIKLGELQSYKLNTRTHSDEQVAQLAASITEFGFTNPLLIDGERQIIAGHGRLAAATKLGMEEVPCIVLDHLTEVQRKADRKSVV